METVRIAHDITGLDMAFGIIAPRVSNLIAEFLRDTSGNYSIIAAMLAAPIFGAAGFAVDYTSVYNLRSELQNAVDSAVLAAAVEFKNEISVKDLDGFASEYFFANYSGEFESKEIDFSVSLSPGSIRNSDDEIVGFELRGIATTEYEPVFAGFLGVDKMDVGAAASVNIANQTIEAAFVFDASGSMTDNDGFQKSTKAGHDMLHDLKQFALELSKSTNADTEFARFALVPFAWGVNVGNDKKGSTWIDNNGLSPHHHKHSDWKQSVSNAGKSGTGWVVNGGYASRFDLFEAIDEEWGGCVDARPHPFNLDDTGADVLVPETLYVPMLAPDEPDNIGGSEHTYANSYVDDFVSGKKSTIAQNGSNSGNPSKQFDRLKWTSKYNEYALFKDNKKFDRGPNRNCFDYEIFPLNSHFGLTNAEIAHLNNTFASSKTIGSGDNDGATNIQQGIVWGWRTLSSSAPYSEGRPENDLTNRKVMIVITDGINSYSSASLPTGSEYGSYGYEYDSWLSDSMAYPAGLSINEMLDSATLATCENAKADGISIFVVGYGVIQGSQADQMLASCAGGPEAGDYYFPVNESGLEDAMQMIMRQLVDIRLSS